MKITEKFWPSVRVGLPRITFNEARSVEKLTKREKNRLRTYYYSMRVYWLWKIFCQLFISFCQVFETLWEKQVHFLRYQIVQIWWWAFLRDTNYPGSSHSINKTLRLFRCEATAHMTTEIGPYMRRKPHNLFIRPNIHFLCKGLEAR